MMKAHSLNSYHCIECGHTVTSLYRDYKAGIIKISHCDQCDAVADKYVEFDSVIILLDTLLLRLQAFRHLLFNTNFQSPWRSVVLLWVCDSFTKLIQRRTEMDDVVALSTLTHDLVGMEIYINYLAAACELLCFMTSVLLVLALKDLIHKRKLSSLNPSLIIKAIVIGNLGRIFAMPALLWGRSYSSAFVWLCQGFVSLSSLQALRVGIDEPYKDFFAFLAVAVASTAQFFIPHWINHLLSNLLL